MIRDIVKFYFELGLPGKEIDLVTQAYAPNYKDECPFIPFELKNYIDLEKMLIDADNTHIYCENGILYFNAYYSYSENCPFGRIYYIGDKNHFKAASYFSYFQSKDIDLPFITSEKLSVMIGEKDKQRRINTYRKRNKENTVNFNKLFKGRNENTIVGEGIYLNSSICLACRKNKVSGMATSTVGYDAASMLGFNLCEECIAESSKANSLFEFIAEKHNFQYSFNSKNLLQKHIIEFGIKILKEDLNCDEVKINEESSTLTGLRKSGVKMILRLTSIHNYAYMIFDKNNKQVGRFDSADHHNVEFGPSHFHYDLPNNNKVKPSFMTGIPLFDIKGIKKFLLELESDIRK